MFVLHLTFSDILIIVHVLWGKFFANFWIKKGKLWVIYNNDVQLCKKKTCKNMGLKRTKQSHKTQ